MTKALFTKLDKFVAGVEAAMEDVQGGGVAMNGGHAFPNITPDMNVDGGPGMSLRDYVAVRALQAIMEMDGIQFANRVDEHAKVAFEQADAFLRARLEHKEAKP